MQNSKSVVFVLLLAGFVQSATSQKATELMAPILGNDVENVKKLIRGGADVNEKFNFGATGKITALFLAVMLGRTEICNVLIDSGADVHIIVQGMTLLHNVALSSGDYEGTAALLIAKGLDVNAKATYGDAKDATPLHIAAGKGNVSVARLLIQNGAEVNAKLPYHGFTSLHLAAQNGHEKVAGLLIAKGADINAKSMYGETPIDLAMSKEHKELAELLRKHGGLSGKEK